MAILRMSRPAFVSGNYKLYPSSYYARPAAAPAPVGNLAGYAQRNLLDQYKYTLQQMAVSPFSVNDKDYMSRIREQYNITDTGQYDLYGNIGAFFGVVGGTAFGLGVVNAPKLWKSSGVFSKPSPQILATRKARNVALAPKDNPTKYLYNIAYVKNKELINLYNSKVDIVAVVRQAAKDADAKLDAARLSKHEADSALEAAEAAYKNGRIKHGGPKSVAKTKALEEIAALKLQAGSKADELLDATRAVDAAVDAAKTADTTMEAAHLAMKTAKGVDGALNTVELGTKATAKTGGFVPIVGIALDLVSLGISAAALNQAVDQGDFKGVWINGIATFLDAVALVADFFPTVGDAVSIGASLASLGVTGAYVGSTAGHSLSAEGLQAQANFFNNLQQSVIARPISTIGNLATLWGVSKVASAGRKHQSKWFNFWNGTGWGNFTRSTLSMTAMRVVNSGTSWLEDEIGLTPDDPSKVNFTNGIGIWGDINDNLFGATLRKTQLVSLIGKDSPVSFSELYERSWGITDKKDQIFNSIMFSEVREAAGIDFKKAPILNSAIDILGEVFVDPQNYVEAYQRSVQTSLTDNSVEFMDAFLTRAEEVVRFKQAAWEEQHPGEKFKIDKNSIEEFLVGPDGILRGNRASRKRFLKQAVQAFAADGQKGLEQVLADITTTRYQGDYGKDIEVIRGEAAANVEVLKNLFTDIFVKGNYTALKYTNSTEVEGYKIQLQTLKDIVDSIEKDIDLSAQQQKLRNEAVATIGRMKQHYGPEAEKVLVEKFMEDLGKDLTPHHVRALYAADQDIRFHMDVVDQFSSLTIWAVMPIQKLASINTIRKYFKSLNNFSRRFYAVKSASAKTILDKFEVFDDYKKNFKQQKIAELIKEKDDELSKRHSLEDRLAYISPDLKDVVDAGVASIRNQTEQAEQDAIETKQLIEEHKAFLKEEQEAMEKDESYTFVPTDTFYNGKKNFISLKNADDAREKLKEALEFEATEIEPSGLSISQYAKKHHDLLEYQAYQAKKVAASDYLMHTEYKTTFDAITAYSGYSLSAASHITDLLFKENADLWTALGYFRVYHNTTVERTRWEATNKEHTRLQRRIDKIDKDLKEQIILAKESKDKLDALDIEVKDLELKLKDAKLSATEKAVVLQQLEVTKQEKSLALTKATTAERERVDMNTSLEDTKAKQKGFTDDLDKMRAYEDAKALAEKEGRVWTNKDFDAKTMIVPDSVNKATVADLFSQVKWDEQTEVLGEIQTVLARSGVDVFYVDEDGRKQKVVVNSKLMSIPKGASLQVQFDVTLEDAFYGSLADLLTTRDTSVILANTFEPLKTLKDEKLTPEVWRKLGPAGQAELVVEMIQRLGLTAVERANLTPTTIRMITKSLNSVALQDTTRIIQIEKLDNPDDIRALVVSNIKNNPEFKKRYEEIFSSLKTMQEKFDRKMDEIEASDKTPEVKAELQILLAYYIESFNKNFKYLESYKYIRSFLFKNVDKRTHLTLFSDDTILKGNELPDFMSVKRLTEAPGTQIHNLEQALVEYVESGIVQEVIEYSKDSIEYAKVKNLSNSIAHQQAVQVERIAEQTNALNEAILSGERTETETTRMQEELNVAEENLKKTIEQLEDVNKQLVAHQQKIRDRRAEESVQKEREDGVMDKVTTAVQELIGDKNILDANGVKIINRHTKRNIANIETIREAFQQTPAYKDHSETRILIKPSKFFESLTSKQAKSYYKLLKERDRRSPGQRKAVRIFAEFLYYKIAESRDSLRVVGLPKMLTLSGIKVDEKEMFIQRIITAYETKGGVEIAYTNSGQAAKYSSTTLLRTATRQTLVKYLDDNKTNKDLQDAIAPYLDTEGKMTEDGLTKLSHFLGRLSKVEETDEIKVLKAMRNAVWVEASQLFEDIKVRNNNALGEILKRADRVHNYERVDVKSLSEGRYVVSYDTLTKIAFRNPKMKVLLENIVKYNVDSEDDTDTPLFALVKLIDKSLSEDYEDKTRFEPKDYVDAKVINGVPYLEKKNSQGLTSLFNLIYVQHVNILHIRNLLNDLKHITPEARAEFEQAYMQMVNENKGVLSYQPHNITREVYMATAGNTAEEWDFIESNAGAASVYNMLSLDTSLERFKDTLSDPNRLKHYLNKPVRELFKLSSKTDEALKFLKDNGVVINKADLNTRQTREFLFGALVLNSKELSRTRKKYIMDLMFYGASVIRAGYTDHAMEKTAEEITALEEALLTAGKSESIVIANKITAAKNKIEYGKDVSAKLKYTAWGDPTQRFEMLLKDPAKLNTVFGFFRDTDAPETIKIKGQKKPERDYVMARLYNADQTDYEYVPVKKESQKGIPNVDFESRGVPAINIPVIEALQSPLSESIKADVLKEIGSSVLWQSYVSGGGIKEIHLGADGSIVLVTENIRDVTDTFDNTNSALHGRIATAKDSLIEELKGVTSTVFYNIYTMSEKQYDSLLDGKSIEDLDKNTIDTEPVYVARVDKDGRIIGEQAPIVNTSAIKSVVPALFRDLERWSDLITSNVVKGKNISKIDEYTEEELTDVLIKYAKLNDTKIIPNQAFFSKTTLSSSETLRRFKKQAESLQAYNSFIEYLAEEGIPVDDINLQRIVDNFFTHEFINNKADGTKYDLKDLDKRTQKDVYDDLMSNSYKGETYYVKVQNALAKMQKEYGDKRLEIKNMKTLPEDFVDTLDLLTTEATKVLKNVGQYGKNLQSKISKLLDKHYDSGIPYGANTQQLRNVNMMSEQFLTAAGVRPEILNAGEPGYHDESNRNKIKVYQSAGINNPAHNNRLAFKEDVEKMRELFKKEGQQQLELAKLLFDKSKAQRDAEIRRIKYHQASRLDYTAYKTLLDNVIIYDANLADLKVTIEHKDQAALYQAASKLRPKIIELITKHNGKSLADYPVSKANNANRRELIALIHLFRKDGSAVVNEENFNIKQLETDEAMVRFLVNTVMNDYVDNIQKAMPRPEYAIAQDEMFRGVDDVEAANKRIQEGLAESKRRFKELQKSSDAFRASSRTRTGKSIDVFFTGAVSRILNTDVDKLDEAMSTILDRVEQQVYPSTKKDMLNSSELTKVTLKAVIAEHIKNNTIDKTMADIFLETLEKDGADARDLIEFVVVPFLSKRTPDVNRLSEAAKKQLDEGISYETEFLDELNKARRKKKKESTNFGAASVWDLLELPILRNDAGFYKYLLTRHFSASADKPIIEAQLYDVLKALGITNKNNLRSFRHASNLSEIRNIVKSTLSPEDMYVFIQTINAAKRKYLVEEHKKAHPETNRPFNWLDAQLDHGRLKVRQAETTINDLVKLGAFTGNYDSNIVKAVRDESQFLFDALAFVKRTNATLEHIMVPKDEKGFIKNTLEDMPIRQVEAQYLTQTRMGQRDMSKIFFVKESSVSPTSTQYYRLRTELNVAPIDMAAEQYASSWDTVGNVSTAYNGIRKSFNSIMYALYGGKIAARDFIKNPEAAGILIYLQETKQVIQWANLYKVLEERAMTEPDKTKYNKEALDKGFKDAGDFFRTNSSLNTIDELSIKAVVAYAINSRLSKDDPLKMTDKQRFEFSKAQAEAKHRQFMRKIERLSYRLNAAETEDEISMIIFGKTLFELEQETSDDAKETVRLFKAARRIKDLMRAGYEITPESLYDMYIESVPDDVELRASETGEVIKFNNAALKYQVHTTQLESLAGKIKRLKKQAKNKNVELNDLLEENLRVATAEYDALLKQDEALKEQIDAETVVVDAERLVLYKKVLANHPELIARHILLKEEAHNKKVGARENVLTEMNKYIAEPIVARLTARAKRLEEISKEFATKRQLLVTETKKMTEEEAIEYINTNYAWALDQDKLSATELLAESNRVNLELNKEKVDLNGDLKDAEGKVVFTAKRTKAYLKKLFAEKVNPSALEAYREYEVTPEDILEDDKKIISIVSDFFKDLRLAHVNSDKKNFSATIRDNKVSAFDAGTQAKLKEILTKRVEGLTKRVEAAQRAYDAMNMFAPYSRWYAGQAAIKLNKLEELQKILTDVQDTLTTVTNNTTRSFKELLDVSLTTYMEKKGITFENSAEDILDYMTGGTNLYENLTELKAKQKENFELIEPQGEAVAVAKKDKAIEADFIKEQALNKQYEQGKVAAEQRMNEADAYRKQEHPYSNSNLGTYMNLNRERYAIPANLEAKRKQEEQVMQDIINDTINSSNLTRAEIDAHIKEMGQATIHNSFVDTMIARLNYMKRFGKTKDDEFYTFDMETIEHDGIEIPYQITTLYNKDGKLVVYNAYFNSIAFHRDTKEDTVTTAGFKNRVYEMKAKEFVHSMTLDPKVPYKLTDDDRKELRVAANKEAEKLMTELKYFKNDSVFLEAFVTMFENMKQKNLPLVTHNGKKFDLPVFEGFVGRYANSLLSNFYYSSIYQNNPDKVLARYEDKGITSLADLDNMGDAEVTREILDAFKVEHGRVLAKLRDPQQRYTVTLAELKQLDSFTDAIYRAEIARNIKTAEEELHIFINEDVRKKLFDPKQGQIVKVRAKVSEWLGASVERKEEIRKELITYYQKGMLLDPKNDPSFDSLPQLETKIDKLLKDFASIYEAHRNQSKPIDYTEGTYASRRKQMIDALVERTNITTKEDKEAYPVQEYIESQLNQIRQIEQAMAMLETGSPDVIEQSISSLKDSAIELDTKIEAMKDRIDVLGAYIENKHRDAQGYLAGMNVFLKDLHSHYTRQFMQAMEIQANVNIKLSHENKGHGLSVTNEIGYKYQLQEVLKDIQKTVNKLNNIFKTLSTEYLKLQETPEFVEMKGKPQYEKALGDAFAKRLKELGYAKEEWYNFQTQAELNTYKKKLKDEQTHYENLEKDFRSKKTYKELDNKQVFDARLEVFKTQQEGNLKALTNKLVNIYSTYEPEWSKHPLMPVLDVTKITSDFKSTSEYLKRFFANLRDFLDTIKVDEKAIQKDKALQQLLRLVDSHNGTLIETLRGINLLYTDVERVYEATHIIIADALKQSAMNVERLISGLGEVKLGDTVTNSLLAANAEVKQLLNTIGQGGAFIEDMTTRNIINVVTAREKTSEELIEAGEFETVAARHLDKASVEALGTEYKYTTRRYDLATKSDVKEALMFKKDLVYYRPVIKPDGSVLFVIGFHDQLNEHTQVITLDGSLNPRFNLSYNYRFANKPLDKIQQVKLKIDQGTTVEDLGYGMKNYEQVTAREHLENFYKLHVPGVTGVNVYQPDGMDTSFESIKFALNFYEKNLKHLSYEKVYQGKKDLTPTQRADMLMAAMKGIFNKVGAVNTNNLHLKYLDKINMTERTENMFVEYVKAARNLAGDRSFKDATGVYRGLADRLLSRFNSRVPGKLLNLIDPDFVTNQLIDYDDESLHEKGIDLINSPEGGMGSTFAKRSGYTTHTAFMHNTNAIRIALPAPKNYASFTAIGLHNVLYALEDMNEYILDTEDYNNNIAMLFDKLESATDPVVFLKNKTLSTVSASEPEDRLMTFTPGVLDTLRKIGLGTNHNIFTPDVVSKEDYDKYNADVLHKIGVNLTVTAANDARAFEDVPLMDYDIAMALGWDKGYKTWIGRSYGFKGGVLLVPGLHAQYGSAIVVNADSIIKRGSYGMLVDMSIHNIGTAIINKDTTGKYNRFIASYNKKDGVIHKYLTITKDNKFLVKPNIDYTTFFDETELFGKLTSASIEARINSILQKKLDTVDEYKTRNVNEMVNVSSKGTVGWQGTLYVTLDSEHITENMANSSEIRNFGGIEVATVDESGTVINGAVLSLSVLYPMLAKSGGADMAWMKAFFDYDNPQEIINQNEKIAFYTEITYSGIDGILAAHGVKVKGNYDMHLTVEVLEAKGINKNMIDAIREYAQYQYWEAEGRRIAGTQGNSLLLDAQFRMAELNKRVRQEAHDKIVGKSGVLNSALFKKHAGGRQQLLANTEHRLGCIVTNQLIWKNNAKQNKNWVQYEEYSMSELKEDVLNYRYENGKQYTDKWEEVIAHGATTGYKLTVPNEEAITIQTRLNSMGLLSTKNQDAGTVHDMSTTTKTDTTTTFTINKVALEDGAPAVFARAYGWMLSMRSPVQDYNGVPLMKVTGYHEHQALEANKYLYGMIGGDNDGDTLGMILIDKFQYEHLKALDATKEEYYDEGYFAKVDKDYIKVNKDTGVVTTKEIKKLTGVDMTTSLVGKKTFGTYKDSKDKDQDIRSEYTLDELYLNTFKDIKIDNEATAKKLRALYPGTFEEVLKDDVLLRKYVNVLIRHRTHGYDNFTDGRVTKLTAIEKPFATNQGYANRKALEDYLNANKNIVELRYAMHKGIKENNVDVFDFIKLKKVDVYSMLYGLDKEDQAYLKDTYKLFEGREVNPKAMIDSFLKSTSATDIRLRKEITTRKVLSRSMQSTVTRVQGSKTGIESLGSNRKIQFISSLILRLSAINRDATGDLLESLGAYTTDSETKVTAMTPVSLAKALFDSEAFDTMLEAMSTNSYVLPGTFEDFYDSLDKKKKFKQVSINNEDKDKPGGSYRTATDVSLADALRLIDSKMSDAEAHAEETYKTVAGILYDAYKTKQRAKVVFESLGEALNKYSLTEGLKEFFNTCYSTKEEQETLYPVVSLLRTRILTKSGYQPEPWEIEWLKIQLFGAQQKEADAFFRVADTRSKRDTDKLKEKIESYANGYLNEHIVGRKELNVMSDRASTIIGVAKHFGSDINTSEWLNTYIRGLVEEVDKHNIRLTNLDPKRMYLSLAVAMDKNPFETYDEYSEIKDDRYNEASKARNRDVSRAVLEPTYGSTQHAGQNLKDLTSDSISIQLLGRLGAHDVIVADVKKHLLSFLQAFDDKGNDISTVAGLKAVAAKAEASAKELLKYGISGYRIRNFIDDYMFNLSYINTTLVQNNKPPLAHTQKDPLVKNAVRFMEIMYKVNTKTTRQDYDTILRADTPAVNSIIQDEVKIDTYYYTHDEDNKVVRRKDTGDSGLQTYTTDYAHEELSAMGTHGENAFKQIKAIPNAKDTLKAFLDEAKLNISDKYYGFDEVKQHVLDEYYALRSIFVSLDKKRQESSKQKPGELTPEEQKKIALRTNLYNTRIIATDINNLALTGNKYAIALQQHNKLKSELKYLNKQKEYLNRDYELLDEQHTAMKGATTVVEQLKNMAARIVEHKEKIAKAEDQINNYAFNKTFTDLTLFVHTDDDDAYTIRNMYSYDTPKLITEETVDKMHDNALMNLHHKMSPFLLTATVFIKDGLFDSKGMYKWLVDRYDHVRLSVIRQGDDDEGLLKRLYSTLFKKVDVVEDGKTKTKLERAFKTDADLQKHLTEIADNTKVQDPLHFNRVDYDGIKITPEIALGKQVTPTLKEINITSAKDLEYVYAMLQDPDYADQAKALIGFVNVNDTMDAYDLAYLSYRHTDWGSGFLQKMYSLSKLMQRLSSGFLLRNWMDTWNQLYSEAQHKYGVIGTVFKTPEIYRIMRDTAEMKHVYQRISLDRTLFLTAYKAEYQELSNILKNNATLTPEQETRVRKHLANIVRVASSYQSAHLDDIDNLSNSIKNKQIRAKELMASLARIQRNADVNIDTLRNENNIAIIERSLALVGSMKFAEYFTMYNKLDDVFDDTKTYQSNNERYIKRIRKQYSDGWSDFKQDLFEISAFMQTNAQLDQYQRDQGKIIKNVLGDMLSPDSQPVQNYSVFKNAIDKELSNETTTFLKAFGRSASGLVSTNPGVKLRAAYDWITADTENSGRIVGYMLDKYLHNLTFEQSVDKSLTRFFNYGSRSPLEYNMVADFPYLSFPIRSINNWIHRITDPRYLRLLSDMLDGIYGQFADDDGQYDDYTNYQIANGWIPIAGGVGLRVGNGAFDVMQLLSDPASQIAQRRSPIGRMISAVGDYLVGEEKNSGNLVGDVIKQAAVVGFAARGINHITAGSPETRSKLSNMPGVNRVIDTRVPNSTAQGYARANSTTFWYDNDYMKYTPKKYQYNGNGRYKYYENMYKDWFTKYGRMRVPKVDPYSLVKEIQWNNYVRAKQSQYRK